MNSPGVIYWSEAFRQTLRERMLEKRREPDPSLELIAAIEETNQRILEESRKQ